MKYTNILIADLKTIEQCDHAIEMLENDHRNLQGGLSAWTSGRTTYLLVGAEKKIEAIKRKTDRLFEKWIKESWIKSDHKKQGVSLEEYQNQELYC